MVVALAQTAMLATQERFGERCPHLSLHLLLHVLVPHRLSRVDLFGPV
jgi:hypothetical protein